MPDSKLQPALSAKHSVSLVIIDTESYELALRAVNQSVERFAFDRVLVFSDDETQWGNYSVTKIPKLTRIDQFNEFIIKALPKYIETDFFLVIQFDGFILNANEFNPEFYNCDYIGAPWYVGYTKPVRPLRLMGVGNGGFSLRCVADFLRVLSRPRVFRNPLMAHWPGSWKSNAYRFLKDYHALVMPNRQFNLKVNEDVFWGMFVSRQCSFFRVAPVDEAVAFAFEAHPDFMFERNGGRLPFGCHAWERYDRDFWLKVFTDLHLDVRSLRRAADPELPATQAN